MSGLDIRYSRIANIAVFERSGKGPAGFLRAPWRDGQPDIWLAAARLAGDPANFSSRTK